MIGKAGFLTKGPRHERRYCRVFEGRARRDPKSAAQRGLNSPVQANGVTREITYRRDSELQAAIADLESRIAELEGWGRPRNIPVRGVRGWQSGARGSTGTVSTPRNGGGDMACADEAN